MLAKVLVGETDLSFALSNKCLRLKNQRKTTNINEYGRNEKTLI